MQRKLSYLLTTIIIVFFAGSTAFAGNGPVDDTTRFHGQKTFPAKGYADDERAGKQDVRQKEKASSVPGSGKEENAKLSGELPDVSHVGDMLQHMSSKKDMSLKDRILLNVAQNKMDKISQKQESQNIDDNTLLLIILIAALFVLLGFLVPELANLLFGIAIVTALILLILYLMEQV